MKKHSLVKLDATSDHVHIVSFGYDLSPLLFEVSDRFQVNVNQKFRGIMEFEVRDRENRNQEVVSYMTDYFRVTGWKPCSASSETAKQYQYCRCTDV